MKVIALPCAWAISLQPFFRIDVAVGHLERLGVADIDLFLASPDFALGILDRDAGALQPVAYRPHDALFLGGELIM